jgi:hypothetical protein
MDFPQSNLIMRSARTAEEMLFGTAFLQRKSAKNLLCGKSCFKELMGMKHLSLSLLSSS